jgi:leucyl-tRNA synthetase
MYDHKRIEQKWQAQWKKDHLYQTGEDTTKEKFYCLDMFPYPSGEGLHVGHPKGYIATDVVARYKMLKGYNVLHPMGWDAFGLPAENYAIKNKVHPRVAVEKNVKHFKEQLEKIGFTYDWNREINTTDPEYYKWTQWIFLQMYKKGLAYESFEPINWCPSCQTGLANEDLENGKCERCGSEIVRKPMRQWVLKMTAYADRLLDDLKLLDWEPEILEQQKNWIGKSHGVEFVMKLMYAGKDKMKDVLRVFTTRIDTVFGMTFCVIAPEHPLVEKIVTHKQKQEVESYIAASKKKSDLERTELKEKTGVFTGSYAINPFNDAHIPIYIGDFVLGSYGTGAVMAVPAHDQRDFEFAEKYGLDIVEVVKNNEGTSSLEKGAYTEDGVLVESGDYTGFSSSEAREKMADWLESKGDGSRVIHYKMRDWVFSRQRYWGEPIPLIHCENCGVVPVPERDLPVRLPEVEQYEPSGTGESPLATIDSWVNVLCPKCGAKAKRETNTMPQWAGSCWYYLRYMDPQDTKALVSKENERYWNQVDLYVGGAEHATRHLLYARFWHKFLYDIGVVTTTEPFKKLYHVGLILAEDGRKMSKRWGNVINPDDIIEQYGADSLRLYEMFMGPFGQATAWSTNGVKGVYKFLERIYEFIDKNKKGYGDRYGDWLNGTIASTPDHVRRLLHQTIKKVSQDIENFRFNTAVSQMMIFRNLIYKVDQGDMKEIGIAGYESSGGQIISKSDFEMFLIILSPFAPHLAEELWYQLGHADSIFKATWPQYDPELAKDDEIEMVVQVNGKVRGKLLVSPEISKEEALAKTRADETVQKWIEGKTVVKEIFVPGKIVNIVIKD